MYSESQGEINFLLDTKKGSDLDAT